MGGSIGVKSWLGKGSCFSFDILLEIGNAVGESHPAIRDLAGYRALVVDDNATNRAVLRGVLNEWGMFTEEASSAVEAHALLEKSQDLGNAYHVALIDLQMPDVDGIQFARQIKTQARDTGMKLILLTSLGQRKLCASLEGAGFSSCMAKPIKRSSLLLTLHRILRAPGSAQAQEQPDYRMAKLAPVIERNSSVLVAEDNLVNQRIIGQMLKKMGYRADFVINGREALSALKNKPYLFILMDCQMPEMDGFEATAAIRTGHPEISQIPIIAITANAMKGDRDRCLAAGMNDYLMKPFRLDHLASIVERYTPSPQPTLEEPAFV